jgi:hypothetical protein
VSGGELSPRSSVAEGPGANPTAGRVMAGADEGELPRRSPRSEEVVRAWLNPMGKACRLSGGAIEQGQDVLDEADDFPRSGAKGSSGVENPLRTELVPLSAGL